MSDISPKNAAKLMAGISAKPTGAELRESREREAQAERALLAVGTIWRENDDREIKPRFVKVVSCMRLPDRVRIQRVDEEGAFVSNRVTTVRRDRFGGTKRGNYAFVRTE